MSAAPGLVTVFFGNSDSVFSNRHFAALIESPAAIAAVVDVPPAGRTTTNTAAPPAGGSFVIAARDRGIPVFEPASPNDPATVEALTALGPELFIAVGYTRLLKERLLALPQIVAANFHASLLPAYRGKHPLFWALRQGKRWAGLTVHVMAAGFDTGDILYQVRERVRRHDSVASLYDRIMDRSVPLVPRLVADAAAGVLPRRPQGELGASYYSSVTPEDFRLDFRQPAALLERWVYASPAQCYVDQGGTRVYVLDAEPASGVEASAPGVLTAIGRTTCTVTAGQKALRLRRVRTTSGGEQTAGAWCRAAGLRPGQSLVD